MSTTSASSQRTRDIVTISGRSPDIHNNVFNQASAIGCSLMDASHRIGALVRVKSKCDAYTTVALVLRRLHRVRCTMGLRNKVGASVMCVHRLLLTARRLQNAVGCCMQCTTRLPSATGEFLARSLPLLTVVWKTALFFLCLAQ